MCSLVEFLKFTGEECGMFKDKKLPTLDTSLWVNDGKVEFQFYEKPTVGNMVLQKDTALPVSSLRASLLQETVRRLINTSPGLDTSIKQKILSKYAQKLINSGHSEMSTKIILVQGVTKYLYKVGLSKLNKSDKRYAPLYLSKHYREGERQIDKHMAKMQ